MFMPIFSPAMLQATGLSKYLNNSPAVLLYLTNDWCTSREQQVYDPPTQIPAAPLWVDPCVAACV